MTLYILIGLPGVGKSKWARERFESDEIFSSDDYRARVAGDVNDQSRNGEVFGTLYRDLESAMVNGGHAELVFDATNLNIKRRRHVIDMARRHDWNVEAVMFTEPVDIILERNRNRERVVPEDIIRQKYATLHVPVVTEPWYRVVYWSDWYSEEPDVDIAMLQGRTFDVVRDMLPWSRIREMQEFDQHNSHHTLDLYEHTLATVNYLRKHGANWKLLLAALYHDIGKLDTQTFDDDGVAHYYGHANVSTQIAIQELSHTLNWRDLLYVTTLIHYHMDAYSYKTLADAGKFARRLGDAQLFTDLILLHEADDAAH